MLLEKLIARKIKYAKALFTLGVDVVPGSFNIPRVTL